MNFKDVESVFSVSRKIKQKKLKQIRDDDLGREEKQQKVPNEMIEDIEKLYDNLENSNILLEQAFNQIADRIEGGVLTDDEEESEDEESEEEEEEKPADKEEGEEPADKEEGAVRVIISPSKKKRERRKRRKEEEKRLKAEEEELLKSTEPQEGYLTQQLLDEFYNITTEPFKLRKNNTPNQKTSPQFVEFLKANKLIIPKDFVGEPRDFLLAPAPLGEKGYFMVLNKRTQKIPEPPISTPEEDEEDEEYKEYKDLTLKILRSIPNLGQLIKNIPSELNYYNSIVKAISVLQVALSLVKKIDFSLIPSEKGKILQIFRENLGSKELLERLITEERIIDTDMTFKKLYEKLIVVLNQINNLLN